MAAARQTRFFGNSHTGACFARRSSPMEPEAHHVMRAQLLYSGKGNACDHKLGQGYAGPCRIISEGFNYKKVCKNHASNSNDPSKRCYSLLENRFKSTGKTVRTTQIESSPGCSCRSCLGGLTGSSGSVLSRLEQPFQSRLALSSLRGRTRCAQCPNL